MPNDALNAMVEILGEVSRGTHPGLDARLEGLAASFTAAEDAALIGIFTQHIRTIRRALQDSELSERGLSLLSETSRDLSRTLKLDDLLRTIVTRARQLVGANLAWVTSLDDDGVFRATAEGHLSPAIERMSGHAEYGAVSLIMETKSFFDTQDYLNDKRFLHSPQFDDAFRGDNIVSLAGFPILSDDEVLGFLFLADRYWRKLTGREISVLASFATHAAVALRNAKAFKLLSEALDEARRSRETLVDHLHRVETAAAAHDEMTSLLAAGAELQHFLQRMANQISGAIFLCDEDRIVREEFASENFAGQLARDMKAGLIDPALFAKASAQSRHTGRSVEMLAIGDEQSRVIALHGSTGRGECLVVCYHGEREAVEIRNLERSAVALSIAKLWNEKRETEKLIASAALLRHIALVTPPDPSTISAMRDRLSLRADELVAIGLIAITGLDQVSQTAMVRDSAAKLNVLVDLIDDNYLAIGPEGAVRNFLQKLAKRRRGWEAGGVVSDPFSDLSASSSHYSRMNHALKILRKMKALDRFVDYREVNLFARIFESGEADRLVRYVEDTLRVIAEKAPRQKAQLKKTLLCYFDKQFNVKKTADALRLHVNTVRQRLETLQSIIGKWDDPVTALELHVALKLDWILGSDTGVDEIDEDE